MAGAAGGVAQTALPHVASEASALAGWLAGEAMVGHALIDRVPGFCSTGYMFLLVGALVLMPPVFYVTLAAAWSVAGVGAARKTMGSFFIVVFGVPLYLILAWLASLVIWLMLATFGVAFASLGPVALTAVAWYGMLVLKNDFVRRQELLREEQRLAGAEVQDIGCLQLVSGLVIGLLCLGAFGSCALATTAVKAPLMLLSALAQALSRSGRTWIGMAEENPWLWWWFPLVLPAWLVILALGIINMVLGVAFSMCLTLVASAAWPAYVSTGWLRTLGMRRAGGAPCRAVVDGLKAGYQVLWASDVITNSIITGRPWLGYTALWQLKEVAQGARQQLDQECLRLTCLPPVVVFGLFWEIEVQAAAQALGVSAKSVEEAWRALERQMVKVGQQAIEEGMLTQELVEECPPELCIGLPARVMLDAIERSPPGKVVLSSGLIVDDGNRPRELFANRAWSLLMEAQKARREASLGEAEARCLRALLLAGGGDTGGLPKGMLAALAELDQLPASTRKACGAVQAPLVTLSLEASRRPAFQQKLAVAIQAILRGDPVDDSSDSDDGSP